MGKIPWWKPVLHVQIPPAVDGIHEDAPPPCLISWAYETERRRRWLKWYISESEVGVGTPCNAVFRTSKSKLIKTLFKHVAVYNSLLRIIAGWVISYDNDLLLLEVDQEVKLPVVTELIKTKQATKTNKKNCPVSPQEVTSPLSGPDANWLNGMKMLAAALSVKNSLLRKVSFLRKRITEKNGYGFCVGSKFCLLFLIY